MPLGHSLKCRENFKNFSAVGILFSAFHKRIWGFVSCKGFVLVFALCVDESSMDRGQRASVNRLLNS